MAAADVCDRGDVAEVDRLCLVRNPEPSRVRLAVDRHHARAECAHALDRAALVAPCADEEDRAERRSVPPGAYRRFLIAIAAVRVARFPAASQAVTRMR